MQTIIMLMDDKEQFELAKLYFDKHAFLREHGIQVLVTNEINTVQSANQKKLKIIIGSTKAHADLAKKLNLNFIIYLPNKKDKKTFGYFMNLLTSNSPPKYIQGYTFDLASLSQTIYSLVSKLGLRAEYIEKSFKKIAENLPKYTRFVLDDDDITDVEIEKLYNAIKNNEHVQEIKMGRRRLSAEGQTICYAIQAILWKNCLNANKEDLIKKFPILREKDNFTRFVQQMQEIIGANYNSLDVNSELHTMLNFIRDSDISMSPSTLIVELINSFFYDPYDKKRDDDNNKKNADDDDLLYAIYRKGTIRRHISQNGQFLQVIGLENINPGELISQQLTNIDNFSEHFLRGFFINIEHSTGDTVLIPKRNARYAEEKIVGESEIESKTQWSVPIIAPIKYPGDSNKAYYAMAIGDNDNSIYYGGMLLATFMLEYHHGVSDYSLDYARKLVEFFIASEMNGSGDGYIVRRTRPFNSGYNAYGEPYLRGASAEELIGMMLGLMYYVRFEPNLNHPLRQKAMALRDNVLEAVRRHNDIYLGTNPPPQELRTYKHGFMNASDQSKSSYALGSFEYALRATRDEEPGNSPNRDLYKIMLTEASGASRTAWYDFLRQEPNFFDHCMFRTSMILILDGMTSNSDKKKFAKTFMEEVIKASLINGEDTEALKDNAYSGVLALWCSKFLTHSEIQNIWDEHISIYNRMVGEHLNEVLLEPNSNSQDTNKFHWQHNLPLLTKNILGPNDAKSWRNHNPNEYKGREAFIWLHTSEERYWKENPWAWNNAMPGWQNYNRDFPNINMPSHNEESYLKSSDSRYSIGEYVNGELVKFRDHTDNQVEGTGLSLIFPRMLLTHIDPIAYLAPRLPKGYNRNFSILPYPGPEPYDPANLKFKHQYKTSFKAYGDETKVKVLRIIAPSVSNVFYTLNANRDDELVIRSWKVTSESIIPIDRHRTSDTPPFRDTRFDQVEVDYFKEPPIHSRVLVIAERAELARASHWIRISLWQVNNAGAIQLLNSWQPDDWEHVHHNAARNIDMQVLRDDVIAITVRDSEERGKLRLFKVLWNQNAKITETHNEIYCNDETEDTHIATYNKYTIVTAAQFNTADEHPHHKLYLWYCENDDLKKIYESPDITGKGAIYDMKIISSATGPYLITAGAKTKEFELVVTSWKIINNPNNPKLELKGSFQGNESNLLGVQRGIKHLSIEPADFDNGGFVIAARGIAYTLKQKNGDYHESKSGLKLYYGHILENGAPSLQEFNCLGNRHGDAGKDTLDVTARINDDNVDGIITAHKRDDEHVTLAYWNYNNTKLPARIISNPVPLAQSLNSFFSTENRNKQREELSKAITNVKNIKRPSFWTPKSDKVTSLKVEDKESKQELKLTQ